MTRNLIGLIVLAALSGCVANYTYQGQKYDSAEKFHLAINSSLSGALSTITPRPMPLTQRKLLFAIPSAATLYGEDVRRFVEINGREPSALQIEMIQNLGQSNYKNTRVFFDAVQRKNIYASAQFIEMASMTGSFAASADTDTLYFVEPAPGSGQWFYSSLKHGKQIFAFDRSSPSLEGKLQAFVDAMQAQAIRD